MLNRYLHQARELQILAGSSGTISVANCNDAGNLLRVLGYRLRDGCGQKEIVLETTNATRAFLTVDSGFPLTELEESLQKEVPFTYPFQATWVPVLFKEADWLTLAADRRGSFDGLVDVLVNDPQIARLYWAMAKTDSETGAALQRSPGTAKAAYRCPRLLISMEARFRFARARGSSRCWKGRRNLGGHGGREPGFPGRLHHALAVEGQWLAGRVFRCPFASQRGATGASDPESAVEAALRCVPICLIRTPPQREAFSGRPLIF